MAKRYYNLEKETKALLKRWEETRGNLPDSAGIQRVNQYILRKKGLGELVGGIGKKAVNFRAANLQNLNIASNSSLQNTTSFSFCLWGKNKLVGYASMFFAKAHFTSQSSDEYYMYIGSDNKIYGGIQSASASASHHLQTNSTATYTDTDYHFYEFVCDLETSNKTLTIYRDGVSIATIIKTTFTVPTTTSFQFMVGQVNGIVNNRNANLNISNLSFHKRLLTSTERTWLYNSGRGVSFLDVLAYQPNLLVNLISWWPLSESGGTRKDAWGTNHLTPTNNPLYDVGVVEELI